MAFFIWLTSMSVNIGRMSLAKLSVADVDMFLLRVRVKDRGTSLRKPGKYPSFLNVLFAPGVQNFVVLVISRTHGTRIPVG
jgi:hypothetical protein